MKTIQFKPFSAVRGALALAALCLLALTASRTAAADVPFSVDGTFTFTNVRGWTFEVSGDGIASPGGPFTFRDLVQLEYGGKVVDVMITLVFASGSTLTICWELPIDEDNVVQGPYEVVGGTGVFEGATGSGVVWYPVGRGEPFTLDGTLSW